MATAANIVINDGATTPAAVTFTPVGSDGKNIMFYDRSSGILAAFRKLRLGYSAANKQRPTTRTDFSVELPVTAIVGGATQVLRTLRADVSVVLPDGCTDAERKDLYAFLYNGLNNALVRGTLRDHDPIL